MPLFAQDAQNHSTVPVFSVAGNTSLRPRLFSHSMHRITALCELTIDNNSETYRPRVDLIPVLHAYLALPRNLGALGWAMTLNAFGERLTS
ncbi:uncharacterized protein PHACADRAFT_203419 [Phanerochaete carnosa HHB-10118-sp]|uniref:Uncharacterized protein n=1 Tax=Phanerochaete carnosa (strain HHB-10118-sp) TaxID=650164 RepID=K5WCS8_PHACS|nr:uncharacterized protein PHACADRAFT_203419 [Phanerochaete carnosa HHB-10118-sp]EKM47982.1 hypothetical protein PHACADRAFT_203419 [Phanerochaete carnosa HHB-10118-sp]